jgi:hypothetical protein
LASEIVQIYVEDQQAPTPSPIENVLVQVYDETGATLLDRDYTSAAGVADFVLEGDDPPVTYQIRLSKTSVAFDGSLGDESKSPQLIQVYTPASASPSGTNNFTVKGQTFEYPLAIDFRMCRASGFFRRCDGRPYANLDLVFTPQFKPTIVDERSVMGGLINGRTDEDGYFEIDLFRNGMYRVMLETLEDCQRDVVVPDQPSFNLVDLLFPVVKTVVFDPATVALSAALKEQAEVATVVTASDLRVLEGPGAGDVRYTSADESVATVAALNDYIVVTAVAAGTTQIDVERLDESIVLIPDPGIAYTPLAITVT